MAPVALAIAAANATSSIYAICVKYELFKIDTREIIGIVVAYTLYIYMYTFAIVLCTCVWLLRSLRRAPKEDVRKRIMRKLGGFTGVSAELPYYDHLFGDLKLKW